MAAVAHPPQAAYICNTTHVWQGDQMGKMMDWGKRRASDLSREASRHDRETKAWAAECRQRPARKPVLRIRDEDGVSWTGTARQIQVAQDIRRRLLPRIAQLATRTGDWSHYDRWQGEALASSWLELDGWLREHGTAAMLTVAAARGLRQRRHH